MKDFATELALAKSISQKAGEIMLRYFNTSAASPTLKKDRTLVTKADTEINRMVIEVLTKETPNYSIWGEEESAIINNAEFTWVCDPVDGTVPFVKGLPISTFSLALVNAQGESMVGVVFDPFQHRLYEAVKDNGAYVNNQKLKVSAKDELDGAFIDQELWINHDEGVIFNDPKDTFNKAGAKITTLCSAVLSGCLVAEGSYDALIFGQGKPEDIAALSVIVTEAGGKVTDLFGNDQPYNTNIRGAIVSNNRLHQKLVDALRDINYQSNYR